MGVQHVVSSRSTKYVDLGQTAYNGQVEGMGLILNSLDLLGLGWCKFVMLCILEASWLRLASATFGAHLVFFVERPDVVYSLLAVDFLPPARTHQALCRLAGGIAEGAVVGLRSTSHTAELAARFGSSAGSCWSKARGQGCCEPRPWHDKSAEHAGARVALL